MKRFILHTHNCSQYVSDSITICIITLDVCVRDTVNPTRIDLCCRMELFFFRVLLVPREWK